MQKNKKKKKQKNKEKAKLNVQKIIKIISKKSTNAVNKTNSRI